MVFLRRAQTNALLLAVLAVALSGCNQDQDSSAAAGAASSTAGAAAAGTPGATAQGTVTRTGPSITGNPSSLALVGTAYRFAPVASDPGGGTLAFSIKNQPAWAVFDPASGTLSGTPTAGNVGAYASITISVSDGVSTAVFRPFTIIVSNAAAAAAPAISGAPSPTVAAGAAYVFRPAATDPGGGKLTFSVQNLPKWAAFDAATGALSGTPAAGDVGVYADIAISVSDGVATASMTPFAIDVTAATPGSVTLSWAAPTRNTNGTTTTDLAGYHIYYGGSAQTMNQVVTVPIADTSYVFASLPSGSWYFAVAAYNAADVESNLSAVVSVEL